MGFSSAAPAKQKRIERREELQEEFEDSICRMFKNAKAGAVTPCPAWGMEDEMDIGQDMLSAKSASEIRPLSEQLGEQAGVYMLMQTLYKNNIPFKEDCLHVFNGANVFNIVYVYPDTTNPTAVVILETKGGSSQCGWRNSPLYGVRVKQGTPEYAETEADVMSGSSKTDVSEVGEAIQNCLGQNPSKVLYLGVRAPYNKKKKVIYEPEAIFFEEV
ncbi:MAG TPA: hypothetical protein VK619_17195 [Pyrinomonadaceae bacterium]|nr:hypothetical protein [Pyrinomonadaceae bacterium]